MKFTRILAVSLLCLAFSSAALAQPAPANAPAAGPKWLHHHKKNPNQNKVHHPKPSHRTSKRKTPKH
jgi:hypothetical protein